MKIQTSRMKNHDENENRFQDSGLNRKRSRGNKNVRNHAILRIAYAFTALFAALCVYFVWFVQWEAPNIIGNSYNPRVDLMADRVVRGAIVTSDGEIAARTDTDGEGNETRVYPFGSLFAPVTGYMQKGKTGVESLANFYLLSSGINAFEWMANELTGTKSPGDNVWLTVSANLQKAASDALGDRYGAVIAMEADTGKILCMVSKPSFDPNTIAEDWEALTDETNDRGQLLNRAAQGVYPPGSTFKILTLLSYVHAHPSDWEDFRFHCTGVYTDAEGNEIRCYNGTAHGEETLEQAFANSCNGAFARIGAELSPEEMQNLAEGLLFNQELPYALPYSESSFALSDDDSLFVREQTAIGQGSTTTSPLHILLLAAAAANGGVLVRPYLIDHTENAGGQAIRSFSPKEYGRLFSEEDAALLSRMMRSVVTDGTGSAFRDLSYEVTAKTGSAEYESGGEKKTHAWCVAAAERGGTKTAVCVLVEDGKSGGSTAAPIARAVFEALGEGNAD